MRSNVIPVGDRRVVQSMMNSVHQRDAMGSCCHPNHLSHSSARAPEAFKGRKKWTFRGLNPGPHATTEYAKRARYHCAKCPCMSCPIQKYQQ
jgi:hypothetical protein